jgi:hypothetical protein
MSTDILVAYAPFSVNEFLTNHPHVAPVIGELVDQLDNWDGSEESRYVELQPLVEGLENWRVDLRETEFGNEGQTLSAFEVKKPITPKALKGEPTIYLVREGNAITGKTRLTLAAQAYYDIHTFCSDYGVAETFIERDRVLMYIF